MAEGFDDRVLFIEGAGVEPGLLVVADIAGWQAAENFAMFDPNRLRPKPEVFVNPRLNFMISRTGMVHLGFPKINAGTTLNRLR